MTVPRRTDAELLAYALGCDVADLPPQHAAQHVADRAAALREADRIATDARKTAAAALATRAWPQLPRASREGHVYLNRRGFRDQDVAELEGRDLVRYPTGGVAVPLRDELGRIVNVVTRWIEPRHAKVIGLRGCPTAGTLVGCIEQITGGKLVVIAEGVMDSLVAALAWPDGAILGAHGCGNYAAIAKVAAPRVLLAGGKLLLSVHEDEPGERAALAAGRTAIAAGLSMRSSLAVVGDMPDGAADLADAWRLGWRPSR